MRRLAALLVLLAAGWAAPEGAAADLRAGVGKADITPRTGYYLGGWTRADRVAQGQHTRLWALVDRGLSERTILMSASHTHSGPGGYANFKTFNTAAPSPATVSDPLSFYRDGDRRVTLRPRRGTVVPVPAGAAVLSARDPFGNCALTSSAP